MKGLQLLDLMLKKMEESGVTGPLPKSEFMRLKAESLINLSDERAKGEALDLLIKSITDAEVTPVTKLKGLSAIVKMYYVKNDVVTNTYRCCRIAWV